jgi:hypothetical protein
MAARVTFRGSSTKHVLRVSGSDLRIAGAACSNAHSAGDFLRMVGRSYADEHSFARQELLVAAIALWNELKRQSKLLPYRYSFEIRVMGREDLKSRGSGGASGFLIDGKIHSIYGGVGECYLEELERNEIGGTRLVRRIDVRSRTEIQTDNDGPIKIFRKKLKFGLPEQLPALNEYLESCSDETIRVLYTEGEPKLRDLIEEASEGGGAADAAIEQIFELGDAAKHELIASLSNDKDRKLHPTIAWILLTAFPSVESRSAVEFVVDRERDERRKNELVVLLGATTR